MTFASLPPARAAAAAGAGLLGLALLAVASPARAAAPDVNSPAQVAWRAALVRAALPSTGCFKASYPDAVWTKVNCVRAPQTPYLPRTGAGIAPVANTSAGNTVGDGHDYAASVTTPITAGTGSFPVVTGLTSEKGYLNRANTYSLQLNSNFFSTPVCNGAAKPSSCLGWQQFVYSNSGTAFMQYWLINWGNKCPSGGWMAAGSDCYRNSAAVPVPKQAATALATLSIMGSAAANGTDKMIMTTASNAYTTAGKDTVVDLAQGWKQSEFNIVGDGDGSAAKFNTGTSITVNIALTDGATTAPTCASNAGTTGETNNLNLGACSGKAGATPSITFVESN
jgi:hypothetical protein